jgi:hypothetical protein
MKNNFVRAIHELPRIILISLTICLLLSGACLAAAFDPSTAALGARPMGLGGAFVGEASDTNAIFLNPAGIASINNWSVTSMSTRLLDTVDYRMAGGTYRTEYGTFGIGYIGTSTPAGLNTGTSTNEVYDEMSFSTNTLIFSYGNALNSLVKVENLPQDTLIGMNLKILSQGFSGSDQENKAGSGMNIDLGAAATVTPYAKAGVTLTNILGKAMNWSSDEKEVMPATLKVGGSFNILGPAETSIYENKDHVLIGLLDANLGFAKEDGLAIHGGLEWQPIKYLALRFGVSQANISVDEGSVGSAINLTAGVGFCWEGISFDYAYYQDSNMAANQSHYFSISYSPEIVTETKKTKEVKETKKTSDDEYLLIMDSEDYSYIGDGSIVIEGEETSSTSDYSSW